MKHLILFALFLAHNAFAQKYFYSNNGKFYNQSIEIKNRTSAELTVAVTFESSERCACELEMTFVLYKDLKGNYVGHPYGDKEKVITAWVIGSEVTQFIVMYDEFDCCSIAQGVYLRKTHK